MRLRRFTPEGIDAFRELLQHLRRQPDADVSPDLLEHRTLTEIVEPEIHIATACFETKGEAAQYLDVLLKPRRPDDIAKDSGLWTWLTLLYFDSVCPGQDGRRTVKNDYYYLYEPNNMRHFYRHLLFVSWRVLQLAPVHNRLFLRSPLSTLDGITTEVMKRLFLTRIPCIFEVLDRLYWDQSRGRPRAGIAGSAVRRGNLTHRLPLRVRQLEMTYDLMSLSADQLIELLGDEFAFARPRSRVLFEARDR